MFYLPKTSRLESGCDTYSDDDLFSPGESIQHVPAATTCCPESLEVAFGVTHVANTCFEIFPAGHILSVYSGEESSGIDYEV